jgi:hypothetical protein
MAAAMKSVSSVVITQNSDIEDALSAALEHIPLEPLVRGKWLQSNRTTPGHRKRTEPESRNLTLSAESCDT